MRQTWLVISELGIYTGRVKIQLIKTFFKNIHTLYFKRFKVFKYRDFTGETNMGFTSSPS